MTSKLNTYTFCIYYNLRGSTTEKKNEEIAHCIIRGNNQCAFVLLTSSQKTIFALPFGLL